MKITLFSCGESAALDLASGRASAFNIIDSMAVAQAPFIIPNLAIISIAAEGSNLQEVCDLRIECNGITLLDTKLVFNFSKIGISRNMLSLQGLVVPAASDVNLTLTSSSSFLPLASWKIFVAKISQQPSPTASASVKPASKKKAAKKVGSNTQSSKVIQT